MGKSTVRTSEQPHAVKREAEKAGVTHGFNGILQMRALEAVGGTHFKPCFSGPYHIVHVYQQGDGKPLPNTVEFPSGLTMPVASGTFTEYYRVRSNGRNTIELYDLTEEERQLVATL